MSLVADEVLRSTFVAQMRLVPGAVAIVASAVDGDRTGLAATAWNSLCADPPMLVVCVNRNASAYPMIQRSRAFSVNLLAADQAEIVAIFSKQRGLEGASRFDATSWVDGPKGQPMLKEAVAAFECELENTHDYGTHAMLVGRVGGMQSKLGCEAMLYVDGGFASAVRTA